MPTAFVIDTYGPAMKANLLMKQNIIAILLKQGKTQKDLADWCGRSESWASKILSDPRRKFPVEYYDRIADLLGCDVQHLFRPGLGDWTDRRSGTDRRSHDERRHNRQEFRRLIAINTDEVASQKHRPAAAGVSRHGVDPQTATELRRIGRLAGEMSEWVRQTLGDTHPRGQAPRTRPPVAKTRKGDRDAG